MRVLQIYDHIGMNCGIMSVIMNWYRHVDRSKIQFDFLVSYKHSASYEEEIRKLGGKVFYMSDASTLRFADLPIIFRNTRKFMKEHAKEYHVVHLHSLTFAYPYLFYAQKYGIASRICHAHSASIGNTGLKSFRNKLMILPLKHTANFFWACSQEAGEKTFLPLGIRKFTVIMNGVDFTKFYLRETTRQEMRNSLGVQEDEMLVAHISNMSKIKNVPFVIRVFEEILRSKPECRLLLVGKKELPQEVRREIDMRDLGERIIHVGIRSDIPELLQAVDVCLMPSVSEGFGLVAVESQLSGVPVITSLGFPQEVYVTEFAEKAELNESIWASKALEIGGKKTISPAQIEMLRIFDSSYIAAQVSDYYTILDGV